ncbi:hypothetical protein SAMN05421820_10885 [Pedobacter steynii]|uniref:Uncharacterized protein n=1 Tax=Pedobacter steynii TaxID=430522 RepID=A0A1H0CDA6_9SPHI|nr:hypothetical protein [Pedobacter steynii]SDN55865.1 hypothetical protein SAMN05421820_10885 [Pedobacter steynii]
MKKDIPKQEEGSEMDVFEKTTFKNEAAAKAFYALARTRLLEVFNWDELCGFTSATFTLTDASGREIRREAMEGDHFKINIPGPGTTTGDGFDWVVVELIREEQSAQGQSITMRARPAANPLHPDNETAHFFKDKATSTFKVYRKGLEVHAEVHGRNEVPNSDSGVLINNVRNVLVGWSAKIGFSYPQWKSLVTALVNQN